MIHAFFSAFAARGFSTIVTLLCGALTIRLYGHYLSPSELGSIAIPLQLFAYLPLIDLGFRMVVNRHLLITVEETERRELVRFGQQINLLLLFGAPLVAVPLFVAVACLHSAIWGGSQIALYASLGLAAGATVSLLSQSSLFVGLGAQSLSFLLSSLSSILNVTLLWLALTRGLGLWALPIGYGLSSVIAFPVILLCLHRLLPFQDIFPVKVGRFPELFTRLQKEAFSCLHSQVSIILLFSADVILASLLFPLAEVGVYLMLSRIYAYIRTFLQIPSEISWPYFAKHSQRAADWTFLLLNANAWVQGITYALAVVALPSVIHWYLGAEWQASPSLLFCLSVRFLLIGSMTPAGYYVLSRGAFSILHRCYVQEMLCGALLGIALGKVHGLIAFAAGFMISPLAGTGLPVLTKLASDAKRKLLWIAGRVWMRSALAFSAVLGAGLLLSTLRPVSGMLFFVLIPLFAGGIVVLAFIGARFLRMDSKTAEVAERGFVARLLALL